MTTPIIEGADCTITYNAWGGSSVRSLTFPGCSAGDLVICHFFDGNTSSSAYTTTPPTPPNSESWVVLADNYRFPASYPNQSWVGYFVAEDAISSGSITFSVSANVGWIGVVAIVAAGTFDPTTPINSTATGGSNSLTSTAPTGTLSASAGDINGLVCAWVGVRNDGVSASPAGWTDRAYYHQTSGANISGTLSTRGTSCGSGESIPAYTWSIDGTDTSVTLAYVIRQSPGAPLLVYWEEIYGTPIIAGLQEPYYNISDYHLNSCREPFTDAFLASWLEPYAEISELLTYWNEFYFAVPEMVRSWREPIIYADEITTFWNEPYTNQPELLTSWREPYPIADADLVAYWTEPYSLDQLNYLMPHWREPYAMSLGGTRYQRITRAN